MPDLVRDEDEGLEEHQLPPQKRLKLHHDNDGDGTGGPESKPGNSLSNPLNINENPASPTSPPRVQTKLDTSKTPARTAKKMNIPSSGIKPWNNLSGNKTSTGPQSSPTPSRVVGGALPTKPEEARAVGPHRDTSRDLLGGGRQPVQRTNPTRAAKAKSREASVTIGSDNDEDELSSSQYNLPRPGSAEDRRPQLKRKDSKEKDRLQRRGQEPIDLEEEEVSESSKRRKSDSAGLKGTVLSPPLKPEARKRVKITSKLWEKAQEPEPLKQKKGLQITEQDPIDDSDCEMDMNKYEAKPTNFTSLEAKTKRSGLRSPIEKPSDNMSHVREKRSTRFQIRKFSWVGRPGLDYTSPSQTDALYVCMDPSAERKELIFLTEDYTTHTRIDMKEIGIYAYNFENGELILNRNKAPRNLVASTTQWILIIFKDGQELRDCQEHLLSPETSEFNPQHFTSPESFQKQKDNWLNWHNKDIEAAKNKQVQLNNGNDIQKYDTSRIDPGTRSALDAAIQAKKPRQKPSIGVGRGLLSTRSDQQERKIVPQDDTGKLTGGRRLRDGRAEPDWEYEDKTAARKTRSSGAPLFGQVDPPRRSTRDKAPKKETPKLLLPEKVWETPLVFPPTGRDRAIVEYDDLTRLNQGEFLNDNLINFYLKFTEARLKEDNPELAKRTHFFNTFFYERLKRKEDGKRDYSAMKNWTKNVDLFEKDFIFVPINEFAHWYLAIICNLTQLERHLKRMRVEDLNIDAQTEHLSSGEPSAPTLPQAPPQLTKASTSAEEPPGDPMQGVEMEDHSKGSDAQRNLSDGVIPQPSLFEPMDVDVRDEIPDSQPSGSPSSSPQNAEVLNLMRELNQLKESEANKLDEDTENMLKELAKEVPPDRLPEDLVTPSKPARGEVFDETQIPTSDNTSRRTSPRSNHQDGSETVSPIAKETTSKDGGEEHRKSPELGCSSSRGGQVATPVVGLEAGTENMNAPIIFILDSLGSGPNQHNSTIQNLRRYIEAEAHSRRQIEIPNLTTAIQGGYADVPEQPNHCDCGVFLLHYVETFLQKPDTFLEQFIQRKMSKKKVQTDKGQWKPERITGMREEILDLICKKKDDLDGVPHVPRKVKLAEIEEQKKADASKRTESSEKNQALCHPASIGGAGKPLIAPESKAASRQPSPDDDSDFEVISVSNKNNKTEAKKEAAAKRKAEAAGPADTKKPTGEEVPLSKDITSPQFAERVPKRPRPAQEAPTVPVAKTAVEQRQTRSATQFLSQDFKLTENDIEIGPRIPPNLRKEPSKKFGRIFGPGSRGPKTPESSDTEEADPVLQAHSKPAASTAPAQNAKSPPSAPASKPVVETTQAPTSPLPRKEVRRSTPPIRQVSSTPQNTPLRQRQQPESDSPANRKTAEEAVPVASSQQSPIRTPSTQEEESVFSKSPSHPPQKKDNAIDLTGSPEIPKRQPLSPSPRSPSPDHIVNSPAQEQELQVQSSGTLVDDFDQEMEDVGYSSAGSDSDPEGPVISPPIEIYDNSRTVRREDGVYEVYPAKASPPKQRTLAKNELYAAEEGFKSRKISIIPEKEPVGREARERDPSGTPAPGQSALKAIAGEETSSHVKFGSSPTQWDGDFNYKKVEKKSDPKLHIAGKTSPAYHTNPAKGFWRDRSTSVIDLSPEPPADHGHNRSPDSDNYKSPEPERKSRSRCPSTSDSAVRREPKRVPAPPAVRNPAHMNSSISRLPPFKPPGPAMQSHNQAQSSSGQQHPSQLGLQQRRTQLQAQKEQYQQQSQYQQSQPITNRAAPMPPNFANPLVPRAPTARISSSQSDQPTQPGRRHERAQFNFFGASNWSNGNNREHGKQNEEQIETIEIPDSQEEMPVSQVSQMAAPQQQHKKANFSIPVPGRGGKKPVEKTSTEKAPVAPMAKVSAHVASSSNGH